MDFEILYKRTRALIRETLATAGEEALKAKDMNDLAHTQGSAQALAYLEATMREWENAARDGRPLTAAPEADPDA